MTDATKISDAMKKFASDRMTVIFSTYQSINVVQEVQENLNLVFDLVICDEAHRTTGFSDKADKNFTKVHDDKYIYAKKDCI